MARLGVTLGDPAGVGPEVTEAALAERRGSDVVLFGPEGVADAMATRLQVAARVQAPFEGRRGLPSAASGRAALAAVQAAVDAAKSGEVDALVTAPISKEALALAGCADRGHTWILARQLGVGPVAMAFLGEQLRVVLATDHVPLGAALANLTPQRVVEVAVLLTDVMGHWTKTSVPHLALAGVNPHAGENGLLGNEEARVLMPAVEQARERGLDLSGPYPADSLFRRAFDGEFDGVVALFHDQGLSPVKMLGMGASVNVTLGLSVPRTSPDHGTAFDLVGSGGVRAEGMRAAIQMALELI